MMGEHKAAPQAALCFTTGGQLNHPLFQSRPLSREERGLGGEVPQREDAVWMAW
jgi:hypothetical protein